MFSSYASYLSKVANFNLPHLHLVPLLVVTLFEFVDTFSIRKHRVSGLSCGIVCIILCLAVSVEHRLTTDRLTRDYGIYRTSVAWHSNKMFSSSNLSSVVRRMVRYSMVFSLFMFNFRHFFR